MGEATLAIEIRAPAPLRAWHQELAARLGGDGHRVRLTPGGPRPRFPLGTGALLALQRLIFRARSSAFAPASEAPAMAAAHFTADLVIALDGSPKPLKGLCLIPLFDDRREPQAFVEALLAGRAPALSIALSQADAEARVVARALPAIEDPVVLARGLDQVTARLVALIRRTVRHIAAGTLPAEAEQPSEASGASRGSPARFFLHGFAKKVRDRLKRRQGHPDHWFIGWRKAPNAGVAHELAWPDSAYQKIADDGQRYLADPFPFEHDGRVYIFCEEYPYATEKGVISVIERMSDGSFAPPRVVLERPYHLSYPQIIVCDGSIFMLPETYAAGRIELYRVERFPDLWVLQATLLDGVMASDATYVEYGGRHWIFATVAGDGGSTWDELHLYHAPDLLGPWTPHAGNPVLIDAGAARPGGEMWVRDGALWRVAQDCRARYGGGLALCRVDVLTPERFAQTVVARLAPPLGDATGVHTLNSAAGIETVDWRALRRPYSTAAAAQ